MQGEDAENAPLQINLPQSQLIRMEEAVRLKSSNKIDLKKAIDRRASLRMKNMARDSSMFKHEGLQMIEFLATYFMDVEKYIESIDQYLQKKRINFLLELRSKMSFEEYRSFLSNMELYRVPQGGKLIEQGKYHIYHYIILEGSIGAFHQKKIKDEEKEYLEIFQYENGEVLLANQLQTHRANPYTVKAKKSSLLLRFKDDVFNRYLKKIWMREVDEMCVVLSHSLVFKGVSVNEIKKFVPCCFVRRFRYNQLVYDEGDLIRQLFLIVEGEAEICYDREDRNKSRLNRTTLDPLNNPNFYRANHQAHDKKQIRIVQVGKKELFGLQAYEVFDQNYYKHHVRVRSDNLKTLAIGLDVLFNVELENPILEENLNTYLKKINQVHCKLLEKNEQVAFNIPQKKKKKKRKMKRKNKNSLEWWGLAAKIEDTKKYKLPTPPKNKSAKNFPRKEPLNIVNRTSKLDYFKRRLFQEQIQAYESINQKQNTETNVGGWVPRLYKQKLKMLAPHPKVMNNAERVKKKLLEYAKNTEAFCDRLQLQ